MGRGIDKAVNHYDRRPIEGPPMSKDLTAAPLVFAGAPCVAAFNRVAGTARPQGRACSVDRRVNQVGDPVEAHRMPWVG